MLIISKTPYENGAYANQSINAVMPVPEGWAIVAPDIEGAVMEYLPFIVPVFDGDVVVGFEPGEVPPAPEPPPPPPDLAAQVALLTECVNILTGGRDDDLDW